MNNLSITVMIGICILGCSSLILFYFFIRIKQHSGIWSSHYFKKLKPSEKIVKRYLLEQQIKDILFIYRNKQITLAMLLNQSEIEFSKTDINYSSFKSNLELSLDEYFSSQPSPAYFSAYFKQSPNLYSKLIYLTLAGYVIAKAGITLIGTDHFTQILSKKILKKLQSEPPYPKQFYSGNSNLLKAATIIPWQMIDHAFNYWLANNRFIDQVDIEINDINLKEKLFKDIMLVGYEVGIRTHISNYRYCTAA